MMSKRTAGNIGTAMPRLALALIALLAAFLALCAPASAKTVVLPGPTSQAELSSWKQLGPELPGAWGYGTGSWYRNAIFQKENTSAPTGFYNPTTNYGNMHIWCDVATTPDPNNNNFMDDDFVGLIFKMKEDASGKITSYMFVLSGKNPNGISNDKWIWPANAISDATKRNTTGLYKITNTPWGVAAPKLLKLSNANWTSFTKNTWKHIDITMNEGRIIIKDGTTPIIDYTDPNPIDTGSYGFWCYSQACTYFRNIGGSVELAEYDLSYDTGGGYLPDGATDSYHVVSTETYPELPAKAYLDGHHFTGWYTDPDGGTRMDNAATNPIKTGAKVSINANTTLHAHWEEVFPDSGKPYAILTDGDDANGPGHLVFFRSFDNLTPGPGQKVESIWDVPYSGTVYTGVESLNLSGATAPWHANKEKIVDAYVEDNTKIAPSSMAWYFADLPNLANVVVGGFTTEATTSLESAFRDCPQLSILDLSGNNLSAVKTMKNLAKGSSQIKLVEFSPDAETPALSNMSGMFDGCSALTNVSGANALDTAAVTDMSGMFRGCSSISKLKLPFDTSHVTDMGGMFEGCTRLVEADISSFDMRATTRTANMFSGDGDLYIVTLGEHFAAGADVALPTGHDPQYYHENDWTDGFYNVEGGVFHWQPADSTADNAYIGAEMNGTWIWRDRNGASKYKIRYELAGGENPPGQPESYAVLDGADIKDPVREGYEFLGWTQINESEPQLPGHIVPGTTGTQFFEAHWTETESITNVRNIAAGAAFTKVEQGSDKGLPGAVFSVFQASDDKASGIADAAPGGRADFAAALAAAGWNVSDNKATYDTDKLHAEGWTLSSDVTGSVGGVGTLASDALGTGVYAVVETTAPNQYNLPAAPVYYTFEVGPDTPIGSIITAGHPSGAVASSDPMVFGNVLLDTSDQYGGISLKKTSSDGTPLAGAEFSVYALSDFQAAVAAHGGSISASGGQVSREVLHAIEGDDRYEQACPKIVTGSDGIGATTAAALPKDSKFAVFESVVPDGHSPAPESGTWFLYTVAAKEITATSLVNGSGSAKDTVVRNTPISGKVSLALYKAIANPDEMLEADVAFEENMFSFEILDADMNVVDVIDGTNPSEPAVKSVSNHFQPDKPIDIDPELLDPTSDDASEDPNYVPIVIDRTFTLADYGKTFRYYAREIDGKDYRWEYDKSVKPIDIKIVRSEDESSLVGQVSFPEGHTFVNEFIPYSVPFPTLVKGMTDAGLLLFVAVMSATACLAAREAGRRRKARGSAPLPHIGKN